MIEERYIQSGAAIYRSDNHGALQVNFLTNQGLSIESWRQVHPRYWHDKDVTIQKNDSKSEQVFILVLADSRPVLLDATGLDTLLDQQVSVTGYLNPQFDDLTPLTMFVEEVILSQ